MIQQEREKMQLLRIIGLSGLIITSCGAMEESVAITKYRSKKSRIPLREVNINTSQLSVKSRRRQEAEVLARHQEELARSRRQEELARQFAEIDKIELAAETMSEREFKRFESRQSVQEEELEDFDFLLLPAKMSQEQFNTESFSEPHYFWHIFPYKRTSRC